jgi:hypothetical protein
MQTNGLLTITDANELHNLYPKIILVTATGQIFSICIHKAQLLFDVGLLHLA